MDEITGKTTARQLPSHIDTRDYAADQVNECVSAFEAWTKNKTYDNAVRLAEARSRLKRAT